MRVFEVRVQSNHHIFRHQVVFKPFIGIATGDLISLDNMHGHGYRIDDIEDDILHCTIVPHRVLVPTLSDTMPAIYSPKEDNE